MKSKKSKKASSSEGLIEFLVFRFLPYWPVFAGLIVICVTAALTYIALTPPVYETTATILIKDEKRGVENHEVMESFNILSSKKIVENEIEVIKSRTLVGEVVESLNLNVPISEDASMSAKSAYSTSPITIKLRQNKDLVETDRIDFKYDQDSRNVTIDGTSYPLDKWVTLPQAELQFVRNTSLKTPAKGALFFSLIDKRRMVTGLLKRLSVQPSNKLSTIVTVSLKDEDAQRGEDILNSLIDRYDNAAVNEKREIANTSLDFIDERIEVIESELDSIEKNIESYKSKRGIVDLSTQGKVFLQNVGDNDQKLAEINMQLAALDRAEDYVIQKGTTQKINPSTFGSKDERLSPLIQKLFDAEVQYERLKRTTAENNPILLSLSAEIENMRPSILENIRNQKNTLMVSKTNLVSTNSKYASVLETIPQQERELLEATRQQVVKNNVYTFLLQKREESTLLSISSNPDSKIVDRAETSINPVAPKKLFLLAASIALGGILGLAWVGIKEFLSVKVLFRKEIEESTDLPVVAEIAHVSSKDFLVQDTMKRALLYEQLRQITASLGLFGENKKRTIMITSGISGEGKSFISFHYALCLARPGKKVLLIDGDLRSPRLSHFHNLVDQPGFTELLSGEAQINDLVRKLPNTNLHFLPAGKARAQSGDVFVGNTVRSVFQKLHNLYDFVIIDTPPVAPVVDSYIITSYCDLTLFVVCHGKTPKRLLTLLDKNITQMAIKNVSIVFNNVRIRGLGGNDFGYGYGYGQKYAYGDGKKWTG